ncbi:hypothetical protein GGI23_002835 [Coemansia sp. RSA 2559]|nr:hypothetical protein GGI23_002835 [Coemansia sp. RSA 2559]KAJ2860925.1 hypothetical protein GGI22_002583 [Coemansia erecta]
MRNASTSVYTAQRMSEIHTLVSYYRPHGSGNPNSKEALYLNGQSGVWAKVDAWLEIVQNKWPEIQRRCDGHAQWAKVLDNCPRAVQAIDRLKAYIEQEVHLPLVFTYNVLLNGSILQLERTGNIEILGFEYARYNYCGFDIANHSCEWMADHKHAEHPHIMDMERYPTAEERHHFLRSYVCTKALIDTAMKAELAQPTERWIR